MIIYGGDPAGNKLLLNNINKIVTVPFFYGENHTIHENVRMFVLREVTSDDYWKYVAERGSRYDPPPAPDAKFFEVSVD